MDKEIPSATEQGGVPPSEPQSLLRGVETLLHLFTARERRGLRWLSVAVLIRGLAETFAVAAIIPFIAVVSGPDVILENRWLAWLYQVGNFRDATSFLLFLGIGVLLVLALSNGFAAWTTLAMERFVWQKHHDLSTRLLRKYLHEPYAYFLDRNTAELGKNILSEVLVVVVGVLVPLMLLVSRGVVAGCVVILLFLVDWSLALVVLLVLGGAYGLVYAFVQRKQGLIGRERLDANTRRFQSAAEALGGIKEAKVADVEGFFLDRFAVPSRIYSLHTATDQVVAQLPRYALEVVAFGGILLIVLVLLSVGEGVDQALPLIGLYAFAGYKLMPALQLVFQGLTRVRFNLPSLQDLHRDLCSEGVGIVETPAEEGTREGDPVPFEDRLVLRDLGFRYPGSVDWAVKHISLELSPGSSLGLVGATGCGKTTLVDLLLGLLVPTEGSMEVDGIELDAETVPRWKEHLAYVPQDIFLLDDSIRRNIAFGIPEGRIDEERIARAVEAAELSGFLSELPKGLDTVVGERGVRLSGGQRQRIGIARALYREPKVLFLDEATSALDGATEERVMKRIREGHPHRTLIVIAHRLRTVAGLDRICLLRGGRLVDSGSYRELLERNSDLRLMAGGTDPGHSGRGGDVSDLGSDTFDFGSGPREG